MVQRSKMRSRSTALRDWYVVNWRHQAFLQVHRTVDKSWMGHVIELYEFPGVSSPRDISRLLSLYLPFLVERYISSIPLIAEARTSIITAGLLPPALWCPKRQDISIRGFVFLIHHFCCFWVPNGGRATSQGQTPRLYSPISRISDPLPFLYDAFMSLILRTM